MNRRRIVPEYPVWTPGRSRVADDQDWLPFSACMRETPHSPAQARTGIRIGLEAYGFQPGAAVLVPALHCAAMVTPLIAGGWEPRFYDLAADGAIDPARIMEQVDNTVRAIIAVHRFGFPEDLEALARSCRERQIVLLEDCTQVGWCRRDRLSGPGQWGDLVIGSSYKFSAAYEGGLLWSRGVELPRLRPASLSERLRDAYRIVEQSWAADRSGYLNLPLSLLVLARHRGGQPEPLAAAESDAVSGSDKSDLLAFYPVPMRASTPLARRLARNNGGESATRRRAVYQRLRAALADRSDVSIPALPTDCVPYMLPLEMPQAAPAYARLRAVGIGAQRFGLPPWPDQTLERHVHARRIALAGLQLPIHSAVQDRDLEVMVDLL